MPNFILREGLGIGCLTLHWTKCSIWPTVKYTCTHPCNLASIQKINYFRVCTVPLEGNCSLTIPGQRNHVLKVYKSWTDNSLTAQVMVYSHIFQHQHTKGIFADTFLPYQSPASSSQGRCPEDPQPTFTATRPASCSSAQAWCMLPSQLPFPLEIFRFALLWDLTSSQRAPEQTKWRFLGLETCINQNVPFHWNWNVYGTYSFFTIFSQNGRTENCFQQVKIQLQTKNPRAPAAQRHAVLHTRCKQSHERGAQGSGLELWALMGVSCCNHNWPSVLVLPVHVLGPCSWSILCRGSEGREMHRKKGERLEYLKKIDFHLFFIWFESNSQQ